LCPHREMPDREYVVDFLGLEYRGNLRNWIDWNVFFFGHYEIGILELMQRIVERRAGKGGVFVDVGSNVGLHSLFMSRCCAVVHAFEPYEPVRRRFEDMIRANRITNIHVHPVGLASSEGKLPFRAPDPSNLGQGSFSGAAAEAGGLELAIARGDTILAAERLDRLDLVKIDVEGYERYALEGLADTLRRFEPIVVFEFTDVTRDTFEDAASVLRLFPPGYRLFEIAEKRRDGASLGEFDFERSGDVLACPAAESEAIRREGREAGRG
jgi:FkbM family methyltransferase